MKKLAVIFCVVALAMLASASMATTWDALAQFSAIDNPNGVWTIGWASNLGEFNLDTARIDMNTYYGGYAGCYGWCPSQAYAIGGPYDCLPANWINPTDELRGWIEAHHWAMGPGTGQGNNPLYNVVRWTAPSAGTFNIATSISPATIFGGPSSVDCHMLVNGVSVPGADGSCNPVNGYEFVKTLALAEGDKVDLAVGNGGDNGGDNCYLSFHVETAAVPEPSSLLALIPGLLGLGAFYTKKRS